MLARWSIPGILPIINTGIAHREAGVGQIGAGITHAPLACFTQAVAALAASLPATLTTRPEREARMASGKKLAVVAIGGNSLIRDKDHLVDPRSVRSRSALTAHHIADMIEAGWNVIVTHGNGPQMGFILRRSELSHPRGGAGADGLCRRRPAGRHRLHVRQGVSQRVPQARHRARAGRGGDRDAGRPRRSRLQGSDQADRLAYGRGHGQDAGGRSRAGSSKEDAGRGWRRVVPSPAPASDHRYRGDRASGARRLSW